MDEQTDSIFFEMRIASAVEPLSWACLSTTPHRKASGRDLEDRFRTDRAAQRGGGAREDHLELSLPPGTGLVVRSLEARSRRDIFVTYEAATYRHLTTPEDDLVQPNVLER